MKFRNPKTGEVFESVESNYGAHVAEPRNIWGAKTITEAARLMGYEVVEETGNLSKETEKETNKVSKHKEICSALTDLYDTKNHDYGDSFGRGYSEYGMAMPVIRLEDKLSRLKTLLKSDAQVNESIEDTLMDLANYSIMTLIERSVIAGAD